MRGKRPTREEAAETRKERLEELQQQLTEGVERLASTEGWKAFLNMAGKLPRYSVNNILLLLQQREEISAVAGYRTWMRLGRQVRKGEEALYVLGPVKYKVTEQDDKGQEQTFMAIRGFKPVPVFEISQTDGPDLPQESHLTGHAPAEVWDGLTGLLNSKGYTVAREVIGGSVRGDTNPANYIVRIDPNLHPMEALAVLWHEWSHVDLGHVEDLAEYRRHRGKQEVECESAVYIGMTAMGFDLGDWSTEYTTGWSKGDPKVLVETAQCAVASAHRTLDVLAPQPAAEQELTLAAEVA